MALTQLAANSTYGIYGVVLFIAGLERTDYFKFLVVMNFFYAGLCVFAMGLLLWGGVYAGALFLLAEGFFIGALASVEKKSSWPLAIT